MPPPKIKTQAFLANLPLFKELAPGEIDRIAAGTTELHVPRGEILFNKGDPCTGFHVVIYGQVKLSFVTPQGSEKVVEIIGPGYSFGEALMFMERPYILMAQALADSLLLHVSKGAVFEGLARDPGFAKRMLAGLSRRLHGLISDVESYSLLVGYTARDRLPASAGRGPGERSSALLGDAPDIESDRRVAPQSHPRAFFPDPARSDRSGPDRGRRPRRPHQGRHAAAHLFRLKLRTQARASGRCQIVIS